MARLILAILVLAGCSPARPPAVKAPAPVWDSVYKLHLEDGSRCSAVAIGPIRYLTAGHCAGRVAVLESRAGEKYEAGTPKAAPEADVALGSAARPLPAWAQIGVDMPRTGSRLTLNGYGCDPRGLVRASMWVSQTPVMFGRYTVVGPVCHGDSGGGVFNEQGELVAVISGVGAGAIEGLGTVESVGQAADLLSSAP